MNKYKINITVNGVKIEKNELSKIKIKNNFVNNIINKNISK